MTRIVIGGAGGFAREAAAAVRACVQHGAPLELTGFPDDDPALTGHLIDGSPVLGGFSDIAVVGDAQIVIAIGRPGNYTSRRSLVERCAVPPDRYASIVHPTASLADTVTVGAGTIVLAQVVATTSVSIGRHVAVMPHVVMTHDDVIGDFATLASGVLLGGGAHVGEGAYLGAGARVREGATIGAWSMVGMGSVVTRDVPPGELWVG